MSIVTRIIDDLTGRDITDEHHRSVAFQVGNGPPGMLDLSIESEQALTAFAVDGDPSMLVGLLRERHATEQGRICKTPGCRNRFLVHDHD